MVKKKSLEWLDCSEEDLQIKIEEWIKLETLSKNSILFLEGEMGAGKSTFVREALRVLSPESISLGSPTFPITQTYTSQDGFSIYHIDLYRLKNEQELMDSGVLDQIEEKNVVAFVEWASVFADSFAHWFDETRINRKAIYLIRIKDGPEGTRNYQIEKYGSHLE